MAQEWHTAPIKCCMLHLYMLQSCIFFVACFILYVVLYRCQRKQLCLPPPRLRLLPLRPSKAEHKQSNARRVRRIGTHTHMCAASKRCRHMCQGYEQRRTATVEWRTTTRQDGPHSMFGLCVGIAHVLSCVVCFVCTAAYERLESVQYYAMKRVYSRSAYSQYS